jgi:hypothetical protein
VWSLLGWNIHVYHSHLDVHPPLPARRPFRFEWHQDGGLAGADGDHAWGHYPAATPLYGCLKQRDLLDAANPPLRP